MFVTTTLQAVIAEFGACIPYVYICYKEYQYEVRVYANIVVRSRNLCYNPTQMLLWRQRNKTKNTKMQLDYLLYIMVVRNPLSNMTEGGFEQ